MEGLESVKEDVRPWQQEVSRHLIGHVGTISGSFAVCCAVGVYLPFVCQHYLASIRVEFYPKLCKNVRCFVPSKVLQSRDNRMIHKSVH